ncbi:electron transfer flavoprotein subunit alpha/FixB family protein [Bacillus benzoevorans]|uniref:Electron transfer flavoprotein alpha subunit n=1 Tax=Bacillus benzoevorans TaxID=1456 RepID=A0A7X0LWS8_9BACI|nr:FAD-binding protein [Bacillus benzoevorans]MBB6446875.1 electron transfer flavoprotein alpha subunit [Bacillus benzoevorans]
MTILVFAEKTSTLIELCNGARQLGDRVEAIVIGEAQGGFADKVWHIPAQADAMFEDYTETIAALVEKVKPSFLLVEPTKRCKLVSGRLAAMLGASVITDASELTSAGEAKHMVYGGAAVRKEKAVTATAIVTVGSGVFADSEPVTLESEVETVAFVAPAFTIKVVSKEQKPKTSADLNKSKRVVGIGRGLAAQEDLDMIKDFAASIGAEVGCSRPIADGEGWMPKELYIGVTGLMLSPDIYVALGISGQIQHVVGINQSKVVIAVNKDKNAPIFKYADYGIVGDLYKVVPALTEHFNKVLV